MTTPDWTRRRFLKTSAAALAASTAAGSLTPTIAEDPPKPTTARTPSRPVVIASSNGLAAVELAMSMLMQNADPLDAVIAGVNLVENDPTDHSVGLGGLPNEDGVVELDSCCMHGPTHKAGGVAALRNIKNPSSVAKLVMTHTDHVLLVGEGALRFARAFGFKEESLLTDEARRYWLYWKQTHSSRDDWIRPGSSETDDEEPEPLSRARRQESPAFTWGTINCCAVSAGADLAGVTTTSGLSYKLPGRVGDSPIIGAGLYVDNAVGAAGSTGRGEANLQNCASFFVVEQMRAGLSPEAACLEALKRVADHTEPRLRDKQGRPDFGLHFYAVSKDGRYGSATMWSGGTFAVCDAKGPRTEESAYLYESPPWRLKKQKEAKLPPPPL